MFLWYASAFFLSIEQFSIHFVWMKPFHERFCRVQAKYHLLHYYIRTLEMSTSCGFLFNKFDALYVLRLFSAVS